MVFLDKLLQPAKLAAVELSDKRFPALDAYVEQSRGRVTMHYGTSQDDAERVLEIIDRDLGGEVDFVVDDASHFYEPTKAAFQAAFPRLRPEGYYFIEDWSWSFQTDFQNPASHWYGQNSLANLVIDLMEEMALAGAVESVEVAREMIKVKRSQNPCKAVFGTRSRRNRKTALL